MGVAQPAALGHFCGWCSEPELCADLPVLYIVLDWPLNVGGKPDNSTLAFVPICFELTVLLSGWPRWLRFSCGRVCTREKEASRFAEDVTNDTFALVLRSVRAILTLFVRENGSGRGADRIREREVNHERAANFVATLSVVSCLIGCGATPETKGLSNTCRTWRAARIQGLCSKFYNAGWTHAPAGGCWNHPAGLSSISLWGGRGGSCPRRTRVAKSVSCIVADIEEGKGCSKPIARYVTECKAKATARSRARFLLRLPTYRTG